MIVIIMGFPPHNWSYLRQCPDQDLQSYSALYLVIRSSGVLPGLPRVWPGNKIEISPGKCQEHQPQDVSIPRGTEAVYQRKVSISLTPNTDTISKSI